MKSRFNFKTLLAMLLALSLATMGLPALANEDSSEPAAQEEAVEVKAEKSESASEDKAEVKAKKTEKPENTEKPEEVVETKAEKTSSASEDAPEPKPLEAPAASQPEKTSAGEDDEETDVKPTATQDGDTYTVDAGKVKVSDYYGIHVEPQYSNPPFSVTIGGEQAEQEPDSDTKKVVVNADSVTSDGTLPYSGTAIDAKISWEQYGAIDSITINVNGGVSIGDPESKGNIVGVDADAYNKVILKDDEGSLNSATTVTVGEGITADCADNANVSGVKAGSVLQLSYYSPANAGEGSDETEPVEETQKDRISRSKTEVTVENGGISVSGGESAFIYGVNADSECSFGDITREEAPYSSETKVTVNGGITATGGKDANAYGVFIRDYFQVGNNNGDTEVTVNGDIAVKQYDEAAGPLLMADGVYAGADDGGTAKVTVDGNITADGMSGIGVQANASSTTNGDSKTEVAVTGNVTATGENSVGVALAAMGKSVVNVLVEGTVKGDTAAILFAGTKDEEGNYDLGGASVTTWAAETSEDGMVAGVMAYGDETVSIADSAVTDVLVAAIHYIIKWDKDSIALDEAHSDESEETLRTANEGEKVQFNIILEANQVLKKIFYNLSAGKALAEGEYQQNEDGSYSVTMERGGAMELGVDIHTHTPGAAVKEKVVPATCTEAGSYESVVYCSDCGEELSRESVTVDKLGHTPGAAKKENEVAATCTKAGSYDEVVYCSVCGAELSRETKSVEKLAHTPGAAVKENVVAATCQKAGSYDEVVYCSVCGAELSREAKSVDKLVHTPGEAKQENVVEAEPGVPGSYEKAVYCTVCGEELSREKLEIPALPEEQPEPEPEPEPEEPEPVAEEADDEDDDDGDKTPAPVIIDGIVVGSHPTLPEAARLIGGALDRLGVEVSILDQDKLVDAEDLPRFVALPLEQRILVAARILDGGSVADEYLSVDALALVRDIDARVAAMDEDERAQRDAEIDDRFARSEGRFSLTLVIRRGDTETRHRITFSDAGDGYRLETIEKV